MKLEEDIRDKSQIEHEHMDRVHERDAAEEEALRLSRIIRGADTKKYKKYKTRKLVHPPKKEMSDEKKLTVMRSFQFLTGFIGFAGLGVTFLSIGYSRSLLLTFGNFIMEIDLILLGCVLIIAGIVGIIGFQHKHDKISDRIIVWQRTGIRVKKEIT